MLRVVTNKGAPVVAKHVVIYDGKHPIAVAVNVGGDAIMYADCVRDAKDFFTIMRNLGIEVDPTPLTRVTV